MQNDHFVNLARLDWPLGNLQALKFCKEQADAAVASHTNPTDFPYLKTPHLSVVRGVNSWAILDYFLDAGVKSKLFEGISSRWVNFEGAPILELRGKYTSLTACHVSSRDERPRDTQNGYRRNNRASNQKNLELFADLAPLPSEDDLLHIIFLHGGRNDNFAYLRIYLEASDIPVLSDNIMLMPSLPVSQDSEFVEKPVVTLNGPIVVPSTEQSPLKPTRKKQDEYSHS